MAKQAKYPLTQKSKFSKEEIEGQLERLEVLESFAPLDFSKVPNELDKLARKEWRRLAVDLVDLHLSELDRNILTSYCAYWSIWLQAKSHVDEFGVIIVEDRANGSVTKQNPALQTMLQASNVISTLSRDIGLTLNSRINLVNAQSNNKTDDEEEDIFKKMYDKK